MKTDCFHFKNVTNIKQISWFPMKILCIIWHVTSIILLPSAIIHFPTDWQLLALISHAIYKTICSFCDIFQSIMTILLRQDLNRCSIIFPTCKRFFVFEYLSLNVLIFLYRSYIMIERFLISKRHSILSVT